MAEVLHDQPVKPLSYGVPRLSYGCLVERPAVEVNEVVVVLPWVPQVLVDVPLDVPLQHLNGKVSEMSGRATPERGPHNPYNAPLWDVASSGAIEELSVFTNLLSDSAVKTSQTALIRLPQTEQGFGQQSMGGAQSTPLREVC